MANINSEFFDALNSLETEKGIPSSYLIQKITNAIAIAVKRDMGGNDNYVVEIDPIKRRFYVAIRKDIVDEVTDPENQIALSEATRYSRTAVIGGVVEIPLETKQFGRIAAQSAKHVIRQGISEAEKGQLVQKYEDKKFEIISAPILKIDAAKGNVTLEIDKSEAILPRLEQIPGEVLKEGKRVMVYVVDVITTGKNPKLMISRTHPGLIKRLFELHTPEIKDGTVEIRAISREAGSRTKISVSSKDENVDAVGACIGPKGTRVSAIVDELCGEKIDVIKFSDKPEELISAALSPAEVISVTLDPSGERSCKAIVPDNQLSLAIGNKGQNVRLAARLTGWKIDISSVTGAKEQAAILAVQKAKLLQNAAKFIEEEKDFPKLEHTVIETPMPEHNLIPKKVVKEVETSQTQKEDLTKIEPEQVEESPKESGINIESNDQSEIESEIIIEATEEPTEESIKVTQAMPNINDESDWDDDL